MSYNLSDMLDKIDSYRAIAKSFNFQSDGSGKTPWSIKYLAPNNEVVNLRNSDWVLFSSEDTVIAEGKTPSELKKFLLSRMSHEELLEFASEQ